MTKKKTIHLIANAHLDPVWLWNWEEGYAETINTFTFVADLMEEMPDLTLDRSSAISYKWIEEAKPVLFQKIKKLVKEKRWNIVGGWWEQPDCNIPCGESFVRHSLYGKRYFREKFNVDVKVGYNPDSFGHNGNLPQILKKSGINFYLFTRPRQKEKNLPSIFWWEGIDGSRVLVCRPIGSYTSGLAGNIEKLIKLTVENFPAGVNDFVCFYGVGDHGGGPTRKNIEEIRQLQQKSDLPLLKFGTLNEFFNTIVKTKNNFPVIKDELQHHARGCYTSVPCLKKMNRLAENKVLSAEILAALSSRFLDQQYPYEEIANSWSEIMFNQFHDILAGSSISEACNDSLNMLGKSVITSQRIINRSLWKISENVDTSCDGMPVLFFNPSSFEREEVREISFSPVYNFILADEVNFYDGKGKKAMSQSVEDPNSGQKNWKVKVRVPPLGYAVYRWKPSDKKEKNPAIKISDNSLENQYFRLKPDKKVLGLNSLRVKTKNWEVFSKIGCTPLVIEDKGDAWGHNIDSFRKVVGHFRLKKTVVSEKGPLTASIRTTGVFNKSSLSLEYFLFDNLPYIQVKGSVNWQEKNKMLKLAFPVNLKKCKVYSEIPYGFLERKSGGDENPTQKWIGIEGKRNRDALGFGLINDGQYGYDVLNDELRLSILRSPVFGSSLSPEVLDPNKQYDFQSQGISEFVLWLLPYSGNFSEVNLPKYGTMFNQPLEYILPDKHKGAWKKIRSFISLEPENLILTVVKNGEDKNSLIIRLYESSGKDTEGTLFLFDRKIKVKTNKLEIKTLRIKIKGKALSVSETDLLENSLRLRSKTKI